MAFQPLFKTFKRGGSSLDKTGWNRTKHAIKWARPSVRRQEWERGERKERRQDACKADKGRKRQEEIVKRRRGLGKTCPIRHRREGQDGEGEAVMPQEREARGTRQL